MKKQEIILESVKETEVRFSELDPLNVVWHGNYIRYLEDGREHFGMKYGISYCHFKDMGIKTPIVSMNCQYKKYVQYGDSLLIKTRYVPDPAAKIILDYTITRTSDNAVVATARTVQVFTDMEGELLLIPPAFFVEWKIKWGLE